MTDAHWTVRAYNFLSFSPPSKIIWWTKWTPRSDKFFFANVRKSMKYFSRAAAFWTNRLVVKRNEWKEKKQTVLYILPWTHSENSLSSHDISRPLQNFSTPLQIRFEIDLVAVYFSFCAALFCETVSHILYRECSGYDLLDMLIYISPFYVWNSMFKIGRRQQTMRNFFAICEYVSNWASIIFHTLELDFHKWMLLLFFLIGSREEKLFFVSK